MTDAGEVVRRAGLEQVLPQLRAALGRQQDWGRQLRADADKGGGGFANVVAWQTSGDKRYLEALHAEGIQAKAQREYMNTEGHWWSDRVEAPSELLQRLRLGGIALKRNQSWPGHTVSWRFARPGAAEQVALLVHAPSRERFKVIAWNLGDTPVDAVMTGWNVAAGTWRIRSGIDRDGDDAIDGRPQVREVVLERSVGTSLRFAPKQAQVFEFELVEAGTPVETRADLGIGRGDLKIEEGRVRLTVHSLGHVATLPGHAVIEDARGREVARVAVPALEAPLDLQPRTTTVELALPAGFEHDGASVRVVQEGDAEEVTLLNNRLPLR